MNMKTKTCSLLAVVAVLSTQAAVVQFGLSPAGTDVAVGLSSSNEVSLAVASTGSGDLIGDGISFNTDSRLLSFAIGYGSAAGFSDLTGPATMAHIHGPAAVQQPAGVLIDFAPYHSLATNPATGGTIIGTVEVPENIVSNLLAGYTYVNVHTASNPPGEIRGQLIALVTNLPPVLVCPLSTNIDCSTTITNELLVSDPEGDAMAVVWSLNGTAFLTNDVAATNAGT